MLAQQAVEELVAGTGLGLAHLGELRERGQELARPLDQTLVVGGGEAGEQERVRAHPVSRRLPLLEPGAQCEGQGRQHGHEDEEHQPRAQTREGKAGHHALASNVDEPQWAWAGTRAENLRANQ